MNPSIVIVILNWNGKQFLEKFLPSVLQSTYINYRVVVVDNGSADDSVSFLTANYPQIELILFKENHGFAKGYNLALDGLESDYYLLLNSDVEVEPGWMEPLVALAEGDKNIAACQPKLLSYNHPKYFEYAGAAGGWLDYFGYPFARGRVFDFCESDEGQYNECAPIFWASGAAMFIRAKVFHEAGGFDNFFFAHQEEIDLCWRIQLLGYKIYSCPQSVVYHVGGGTLPKGNSLKTYLNFRNNHIMLYKNMNGVKKFAIIPFRILLDAISAFKSLLSGDGGYFIAVVSAHLSFAKWVVLKQRESVFPKSHHGQLRGYWKGNMVWEHFAKGKKKFSQIVHNAD